MEDRNKKYGSSSSTGSYDSKNASEGSRVGHAEAGRKGGLAAHGESESRGTKHSTGRESEEERERR